MTEPDVALTDYGITFECALFAWLLFRGGPARGTLRRPFVIFFAAAGLGAFAGGTVHGFLLDEASVAGAVLWRMALLAVGLSACAAWSIGARLLFAEGTARSVERLAGVGGVAYAIVVLALDERFWIAIAFYAPSVLFLGVSFFAAYRREPDRPILAGLIGVVLTIVAALVQRLQIALHPVYLNHNTFYHLIQMAAFGLVFLAGRRFIAAPVAVTR
jgi:uncharacterized protein DUF6962